MNRFNKLLLYISIFFFVFIIGQLGMYFVFIENTKLQEKAGEKQSATATCEATSERCTKFCYGYAEKRCAALTNSYGMIQKIQADESAYEKKDLLSLVLTYEYRYKIKNIRRDCSVNLGDKELKADICIDVYINGDGKNKLIYKFLNKPDISVFHMQNNKSIPIKLTDVKDGDTVLLKSSHDVSKGARDFLNNYNNVIDLRVTKLN